MSFPRYPSYKDSGVEWLGDVPTNWDIVQFKQFVDIQNGTDHKHVEQAEGYPVVGSGGVFAYASDFLYEGESVLLGRKGTIDKPLHITGRFWTVDTMYWTKIHPDASGRFAYYSALTIPFNFYSTNTALPSMTKGALSSHRLARPPLPEQTQIAAFLDRETAKIDALISEQQRLMELLKEKRQAVISHAVTKGLNPNAPMKSSGIEWLGDVPKHWRVVPLNILATMIQTGPFGSQLHSADYVDNGIPVINPSNIKDGKIEPDWSCSITAEDATRLSQHKLVEGDIVFGRRGEMGRCALVSTSETGWICGTGSLNVRLSQQASPRFVAIYLGTEYVRERLKLESVGSTMDNLNTQILGSVNVPISTVDEQKDIATYLEKQSSKFDTLTTEAQHTIDLLQERRTALISAAVTGQIDVRGLAESQEYMRIEKAIA